MERLRQKLELIQMPDETAMAHCQERWNSIAKPLHSLGKLEEMLIKIAGITGESRMKQEKKALLVLCSDNGVVREGVTQTGSEVTAVVAENFLTGAATASILCRQAGADIFPVDMGMLRDTKVRKRKLAYGTANICQGPAMTRGQVSEAILTGIDLVREKQEEGYGIIATGEMGIGNTTTSSAVASVLLDVAPETVTGKGAGLPPEGLIRKIDAIRRAIQVNQPDQQDPLDVLAKVGGFDLAGLTGVFLGGAIYRIPIVIDGMISAVAALCAVGLEEKAIHYMLPSHVSREPAAARVLEALQLPPLLTCDMSLGEGTGAVMLFPLLDMAVAAYEQMSTFSQNEIEAYEDYR